MRSTFSNSPLARSVVPSLPCPDAELAAPTSEIRALLAPDAPAATEISLSLVDALDAILRDELRTSLRA